MPKKNNENVQDPAIFFRALHRPFEWNGSREFCSRSDGTPRRPVGLLPNRCLDGCFCRLNIFFLLSVSFIRLLTLRPSAAAASAAVGAINTGRNINDFSEQMGSNREDNDAPRWGISFLAGKIISISFSNRIDILIRSHDPVPTISDDCFSQSPIFT